MLFNSEPKLDFGNKNLFLKTIVLDNGAILLYFITTRVL